MGPASPTNYASQACAAPPTEKKSPVTDSPCQAALRKARRPDGRVEQRRILEVHSGGRLAYPGNPPFILILKSMKRSNEESNTWDPAQWAIFARGPARSVAFARDPAQCSVCLGPGNRGFTEPNPVLCIHPSNR